MLNVYETLERPLLSRSSAHGAARHFDRPPRAVAALRRVRPGGRRPRSRDPEAGRRAGQCRQPQADRRHSVRQTWAAGRHQNQDRAVVDRRASARRPRRAGPRTAAEDSRLAAGVEAEIDLYRRAARLRQSDDAPRAHELRARRHHDRPAVVVGSEPAEHPGPHRGRPQNPPRLRRRRPATNSSPPIIRRSSCGCSPRSPRSNNCARRSATGSTFTP